MAILDVPMSDVWRNCVHRFEEVADSASGRDVECWRCGCPGEINDKNEVDWPTT